MNYVLVIPHIKIQNANALSSPFTVGFPAITAWMGAMHALQRNLHLEEKFNAIQFSGIGIVSHDFKMKSYRENVYYPYSLVSTANPVDYNGNRPPFIEEAHCSLEVSLVTVLEGYNPIIKMDLLQKINSLLIGRMRIASGDVLSLTMPYIKGIKDDNDFKQLKTMLMPGYILIERKELAQKAMEEGMDGIDAILEYLKVINHCSETEPFIWERKKREPGWIVPIAVGFQAISDFFNSSHQRDMTTQHRFAESIVTLGEFIMPYRISRLSEMLWFSRYEKNTGLYLCENNNN